MIAHLVETGWLIRIGPGEYQLLPAKTGLDPYPSADKFVASGQLSGDGFIAFGSAAEMHGLTTQIFQSVFVATTKRSHVRKGPPVRIVYVHVKEDNFIGFQHSNRAPDVKLATIERTLIDAANRPDLCGGISDLHEIFRKGILQAKPEKILESLPSYGSKSLIQRMGFMMEAFGYKLSKSQEQNLQAWSAGNFTYLFNSKQAGTDKHKRYSSKWRLVINAPGFLQQGDSE